MMSYMASAAWSHPVLLLYCTEHGLYRGAVMSGHVQEWSVGSTLHFRDTL
jgi:hypothetical protein